MSAMMTDTHTIDTNLRPAARGTTLVFEGYVEIDQGDLALRRLPPASARIHASVERLLAEHPPGPGSILAMLHGTLIVRLYRPATSEPEVYNSRDHLYFVATGNGYLFNAANRRGDDTHQCFKAGDVLFVPGGVAHRFHDISDDCLIWSVFYGPTGGEDATNWSPGNADG